MGEIRAGIRPCLGCDGAVFCSHNGVIEEKRGGEGGAAPFWEGARGSALVITGFQEKWVDE